MNKTLIKIIHKIVNELSLIKVCVERIYIRAAYRDVVNDLNINSIEDYDHFGKYVTMQTKPPKNYKEQMRSFNCDENGVRRHQILDDNGQTHLVYNTIHIAQQGLTEYGYYLYDKDEIHLKHMDAVANWFIENQDVNSGAWINNFNLYNPNYQHG